MRTSLSAPALGRLVLSAVLLLALTPAPALTQDFPDFNLPDGEILKYRYELQDAEWKKQYLGNVKRGMQTQWMRVHTDHAVIDGTPHYKVTIEQLQVNNHTVKIESLVKRGRYLEGVKSTIVEKGPTGALAERRELHYAPFFRGFPQGTVPVFSLWVFLRGMDFAAGESRKIHFFVDKNMTFPLDITSKDIDNNVVVKAGTFRGYRAELMPDLATLLPTAPRLLVTVIERFLKPINLWFDADDPSHKMLKIEGKPFPGAPKILFELEEIIDSGTMTTS